MNLSPSPPHGAVILAGSGRNAALVEAIEHLPPASMLRIAFVDDLEPRLWLAGIGRELVLRDYALTVAFANGLVEAGADALNMVRVQERRDFGEPQELRQRQLAFE